ncbi:unnamed protein product [Heligmosomoides polygyrus]|uniref:Uncharacterized protein n=1 Tax=Heligmosomoides polygyrus TaxID=6339 RepID=A0A3P8ALP5_HELPZ|nr:unnamed protein product [Heligmosomoides polygyrus]
MRLCFRRTCETCVVYCQSFDSMRVECREIEEEKIEADRDNGQCGQHIEAAERDTLQTALEAALGDLGRSSSHGKRLFAPGFEKGEPDFCPTETRWFCCKSRDIGRGFKAVLCGSPRTTSGVGMIVSERFRDAIASVERFDNRLMKIVVAVEERRCHFFSANAPQTGCAEQTKDEFWSLLDEKTAEVLL